MTTANFVVQPVEAEELNETFERQVTEILEGVEEAEPAPKPKVVQLGYTMPCAGVRYYSFVDVEG